MQTTWRGVLKSAFRIHVHFLRRSDLRPTTGGRGRLARLSARKNRALMHNGGAADHAKGGIVQQQFCSAEYRSRGGTLK